METKAAEFSELRRSRKYWLKNNRVQLGHFKEVKCSFLGCVGGALVPFMEIFYSLYARFHEEHLNVRGLSETWSTCEVTKGAWPMWMVNLKCHCHV